ncbi:lysoplasmalogenase [Alterisphingorhabdus coralli]|uniref:Lysoplasmalogenase n=1 Tax=Alterisphingorhabdus coralli TaxID=3071408 RepID=A0AA97HZ06_9SPHN|nr:lysoplasmalogenase [Parasphingorhabdus sp. SCSIO 66989]WOE74074.1 lysoplasmalogenase [Parasphingorhabdus sp. SCSIO 66989]
MKQALVEDRPFLILSLVFAIGFPFLRDGALPESLLMVWKAGAVAMLALYALRRLKSLDGWLLCGALALSALGDALIILDLTTGAIAFLASHIVAIALYARNRREQVAPSQRLLGILLVIIVPLLSHLVSFGEAGWGLILYGLGLGLMAGMAWASRFPRYRVGIGAVLFVVSDLCIFAGMGISKDGWLVNQAVWPLYYAGQLMIAMGVVRFLRVRPYLSA